MQSQQENNNQHLSDNRQFTDGGSIKLRLDTEDLLNRIELYIKGTTAYINPQTGEYEEVNSGHPKANKHGVQSIMGRLSLLLNPQTVQGNWKDERFIDALYNIRMSLAEDIMVNREDWNISTNDYMGIIDSIMEALEAYLSRLLDNKERESYAHTMRSMESNTLQSKRGLGIFKN